MLAVPTIYYQPVVFSLRVGKYVQYMSLAHIVLCPVVVEVIGFANNDNHTSVLLVHYFVLTHPATDTLGWWQAILTSHTVAHCRLDSFLLAIAHSSLFCSIR